MNKKIARYSCKMNMPIITVQNKAKSLDQYPFTYSHTVPFYIYHSLPIIHIFFLKKGKQKVKLC